VQLDDLDPEKDWRLQSLTLTGNAQFSTRTLRQQMLSKTRWWIAPWQSFPRFDPVTFATDLTRLQRFYEMQGYYDARVSYDLTINEQKVEVAAQLTIDEGEPIRVRELSFALQEQPSLRSLLDEVRPTLPLREGEIFSEERYQQSEATIKNFFLDHHYGRVTVQRTAQVIRDRHAARVQYAIETGPTATFGETTIEGTQFVAPDIVRRELRYKPGDPFTMSAITDAQKRIAKLDLFSTVRFVPQESPNDPTTVPMHVHVSEKPFREWKLGVGYGTEDQVRGLVYWRHNNWFGGGRRFTIQAKASMRTRQIEVNFLQPYVLGTDNRFLLTFRPQQINEPGYLLNTTRLQSRLERDFTNTLTGFVAYRAEYDQLNNVEAATIRRLREFTRNGALSGLSLGAVWNTTDDPLDATQGNFFSLLVEQVGGPLGGDFDFIKLLGEARHYREVYPRTVFASRVKIGVADPVGRHDEVPLFERFYAGGANSVRGYGRHRLGPLSTSDDPVGGRSVVEGALELRYRYSEQIGGAVFLDFGQVSTHSFAVPVEDLRFALGFGVLYATPVGPLRLDLGFPLDPPRDDQFWQVHFSIGQFF
jgi:outer membrane protein insertion porin family/translocation and assembly module TamA